MEFKNINESVLLNAEEIIPENDRVILCDSKAVAFLHGLCPETGFSFKFGNPAEVLRRTIHNLGLEKKYLIFTERTSEQVQPTGLIFFDWEQSLKLLWQHRDFLRIKPARLTVIKLLLKTEILKSQGQEQFRRLIQELYFDDPEKQFTCEFTRGILSGYPKSAARLYSDFSKSRGFGQQFLIENYIPTAETQQIDYQELWTRMTEGLRANGDAEITQFNFEGDLLHSSVKKDKQFRDYCLRRFSREPVSIGGKYGVGHWGLPGSQEEEQFLSRCRDIWIKNKISERIEKIIKNHRD